MGHLFPREQLERKSLEEILFIIVELGEMQMSAIDNLNAAVSQLQSEVAALIDKVTSTDQSPAIQSAADAITAVDNQIANVLNPPFVTKLTGETYDAYVARATAAGQTILDEASWDALPVS